MRETRSLPERHRTSPRLGLRVCRRPQPLRQSLPPNTWVNLQPGGVAVGSGVGDEGYSTFVYAPGLRKTPVWGKYRSGATRHRPTPGSLHHAWKEDPSQ